MSRILLGQVGNLDQFKRIIIVPDGILNYLPFSALPLPQSLLQVDKSQKELSQTKAPIISRFELLNLPSASTLAALNSQSANRKKPTKSTIIFADPVFEQNDSRITKVAPSGTKSSDETAKRSGDLNTTGISETGTAIIEDSERAGIKLTRLKYVEQEARRIKQLSDNESKLLLDFDASVKAVTDTELQDYRIIHLATHGFFNNLRPELSSIVLSLFDKEGNQQAGFLTMGQISNLKLNAELVVLSACQTGIGKEVKGEGVLGINRGFLNAGAARVMYSLWNINDQSTTELMGRFYQGLLKDGKPATKALRDAQLALWQDKRFSHPYYWAAFQIQGIW